MPVEHLQCPRLVVEGVRIVGSESSGLIEGRDRLVVPLKLIEDGAATVPCFCGTRVDRQRLIESRERLGGTLQSLEYDRVVEERGVGVRIEFQRRCKIRFSLGESAKPCQDDSEQIERAEMRALPPQHFAECYLCLCQMAGLEHGEAVLEQF